MSLRLILAATAALALAAPVLAQEPPTQPVAAAVEAKSPEVLAFEARAAAFSDRLALFKSELEAAIAASRGDQAKGMADIEVIIARYEPEIDAFAPELEAYFDAQIADAADDAQRQTLIAAKATNSAGVRGMTNHVRTVAPDYIKAAAPPPSTASN